MKRPRPWALLNIRAAAAAVVFIGVVFLAPDESLAFLAAVPTLMSTPYHYHTSILDGVRINSRLPLATSSADLKKSNDSNSRDKDGPKKSTTSHKGRSKQIKSTSTTTRSSKTESNLQPTTFSKDSVVHRLKQASLRAAARKEAEQRQKEEQEARQREQRRTVDPQFTRDLLSSPLSTLPPQRKMASLRDLTAAIDLQLQQQNRAQQLARGGAVNVMGSTTASGHLWSARDSMAAIMAHNFRHEKNLVHSPDNHGSANAAATTTPIVLPTSLLARPSSIPAVTEKHVAVVLSKPLQDDQVTVEYASRIQRLVHAIKCEEYRPDVVVLVGDRHGNALLADCDAGYTYLRHLCAMQQVDLTAAATATTPTSTGSNMIHFRLERSSVQEGALENVAQYLRRQILPIWIDELKEQQQLSSSSMEIDGGVNTSQNSRRQRVKLHVHFSLISSEYHLCILNDIHIRSPVNSPLKALERWSVDEVSNSAGTSSSAAPHPALRSSWLQMDASWSYLYAATPRHSTETLLLGDDDDNNPISSLASACYRRAQSLIPVLQNLRGVAQNHEFFQRDNYSVLVQARRGLVQDMEDLYRRQPSLAAVQHRHQYPPSSTAAQQPHQNASTTTMKPLDVVLEGALLSLGRCLDLVRPAGLLTGSVPAHDFRLAVGLLEQTVAQISVACDPDRPLPASEWGVLVSNSNHDEA